MSVLITNSWLSQVEGCVVTPIEVKTPSGDTPMTTDGRCPLLDLEVIRR